MRRKAIVLRTIHFVTTLVDIQLSMFLSHYNIYCQHCQFLGVDNALKYEQNCFVAFEEKDLVLRVLQDTLETMIHNPLNNHD